MLSHERIREIVNKIDRDHLHSKMNICTELEGPKSVLSVVIIWTRFELYIIKLKYCVLNIQWINAPIR